jgi:hypothetical protein
MRRTWRSYKQLQSFWTLISKEVGIFKTQKQKEDNISIYLRIYLTFVYSGDVRSSDHVPSNGRIVVE